MFYPGLLDRDRTQCLTKVGKPIPEGEIHKKVQEHGSGANMLCPTIQT